MHLRDLLVVRGDERGFRHPIRNPSIIVKWVLHGNSPFATHIVKLTLIVFIVIQILEIVLIVVQHLVLEGLASEIVHCAGNDLTKSKEY